MMTTFPKRRAPRAFHLRRAPTSRPPHNGILVVEHEFEGGPFAGRRMTGLASTFDMHVERLKPHRVRLVVHGGTPRCIGAYRFERRYDCARTLERVHVYRWEPCDVEGR